MAITPLAAVVCKFILEHGYVTAERAWDHLGKMPSGSLTRRITELHKAGYHVRKQRCKNPINGRRYTRYSLDTAAAYN
jgi:hypothetical protein